VEIFELRCGYKLYPPDGRIDLCQIESRVVGRRHSLWDWSSLMFAKDGEVKRSSMIRPSCAWLVHTKFNQNAMT
jgi:hypothetical protein